MSVKNKKQGKLITPPLKYHGGKTYLAPKIIDLMPKHRIYVEPFFGGGAVLFRKDPIGVSEIVGDLNGELTNFWRVLQRQKLFERFRRRVEAIPFSRIEWEEAKQQLDVEDDKSMVTRAVLFFVVNRQSMAGRMKSFAPESTSRLRRGRNEQVSAWCGGVDGLTEVHERLMRVFIENKPAVELMKSHDLKDAVVYCDPPYAAGTRSSPDVYGEFEMTDKDHREFLATANSMKHAKVLISGYACEMYARALKGWTEHTFDMPNHSASGSVKNRKTERVWTNY